jgi:hypothetical protein
MLSTSDLLNIYVEEGRPDKAEALAFFLDYSEVQQGEDLSPPAPEEDDGGFWIEDGFHVPPDCNWN